MNWIYYLLEANLYVAVFYLFYIFILKHETFYQLNRAYLLTICVIAFIIPLLQIGILKKAPQPAYSVAPAVVVTNYPTVNVAVTDDVIQKWSPDDYYLAIYGVIVMALVFNLSIKIIKLYRLTRNAKKTKGNTFYIVDTDDNNAFSFLKYLFINPQLSDTSTIIRHELVHIRQKHSLDIIFLEVFRIINWFNPVAYLLLGSIKELHEFIADRETISSKVDVDFYSDFLLQSAYDYPKNALTNNFFNKNLLKKRIMMLYQKPSGKLARLKYLVTIPLCTLLLCISTIGFSKNYGLVDILPGKSIAIIAPADSNAPAPKAVIMRPPPPIFTRKPYADLSNYIMTTMLYPKNAKKDHHSGMVILRFNLGSDNLISNVIVSKSAGFGFDEAAIKAIKSYTKPIKDKAGSYQIGVGFYSFYTSKQITVSKQIAEQPDFVGTALVVDEIPKQFSPNPKPEAKSPNSEATPAASRPDKNQGDETTSVTKSANSTQVIDKQPFDSLYKYMAAHIRYPAKARTNLVAGRLFVRFTVANGKIEDAKITRALDPDIDREVLRVIKNFDGPLGPAFKRCDLPVSFTIIDKNGKLAGNPPPDTRNHAAIKVTDAPSKGNAPGRFYTLNEVVVATYL